MDRMGIDERLRRYERARSLGALDPESEQDYLALAWRSGPTWPFVRGVVLAEQEHGPGPLQRQAAAIELSGTERWGWVHEQRRVTPHQLERLAYCDREGFTAAARHLPPPASQEGPIEAQERWVEFSDGGRVVYLALSPPEVDGPQQVQLLLATGFRPKELALPQADLHWADALAQEALADGATGQTSASRADHANAIRKILRKAGLPFNAVSVQVPRHAGARAVRVTLRRADYAARVSQVLTIWLSPLAGAYRQVYPTGRDGVSEAFGHGVRPRGLLVPDEFSETYRNEIRRAVHVRTVREAKRRDLAARAEGRALDPSGRRIALPGRRPDRA